MPKDVTIRILSEAKSRKSIIKRSLMKESKENLVDMLLLEKLGGNDPRDPELRPTNKLQGGTMYNGIVQGTTLGKYEEFGITKIPYWDLKQHVEWYESDYGYNLRNNYGPNVGYYRKKYKEAKDELKRRDKRIENEVLGASGARNPATERQKVKDQVMDPHLPILRKLAKEKKKKEDARLDKENREDTVLMTCMQDGGCPHPIVGSVFMNGDQSSFPLADINIAMNAGFEISADQQAGPLQVVQGPDGQPMMLPSAGFITGPEGGGGGTPTGPGSVAAILKKVRKDAIRRTKYFVRKYLRGDVSKLADKIGSSETTVNQELVNAIAMYQSSTETLVIDGIAGPNTMRSLGLIPGRGRTKIRKKRKQVKATDKEVKDFMKALSPDALLNVARKELEFERTIDGMNQYWVAKLKGGKSASGKLDLPGANPSWHVFSGKKCCSWRITDDRDKNKKEETRQKRRTIINWVKMFQNALDLRDVVASTEKKNK